MRWPVLTIASFTLLEALRSRLLWLVFAVLLAAFGLAEFIGSIALTESLALKSGMLGAGLRLFSAVAASLHTTLIPPGLDDVFTVELFIIAA